MVLIAPGNRAQALAASMENSMSAASMEAGDSLGTIEELRLRSGFARATVSEAIRLLVDRGLAEVRPGRGGGVFVAGTGPVVRLRHTLLTVQGDAASIADAISIREALEPLILMDAARFRTKEQIQSLQSFLVQLEDSRDDHDAFIRSVWALHAAIALISPNEMLRAMYLALMHIIQEGANRATSDAGHSADYRAHRLAVHRELVDSIDAGDLDRTAKAAVEHSDQADS
ncbi:MAG: GntR family transcriptional repressor for pyruvate dehydrogenase complex [Pontimonas sp.]|jgi:GntR family transcriptional repressor for pyruvate dehydrogenase complex